MKCQNTREYTGFDYKYCVYNGRKTYTDDGLFNDMGGLSDFASVYYGATHANISIIKHY